MPDKIIVIGSSTGGPKVLNVIFEALPVLDAAIIIVQHIPVFFDKVIAERMNENTRHTVKLAEHGEALKPGVVYFAPAKRHLKLVKNSRVALTEEGKVNCCCPSIDVTMMSLVKDPSTRLLAAILTGMGHDGADGLAYVKSLGGTTLAQDEATSVIFGMPKGAIDTGKVDHVLEPVGISEKLVEFAGELGTDSKSATARPQPSQSP